MNIGVDMDSVIVDIMGPLDLFHNRAYKTNLKYDDHRIYDLSTVWLCSKEEVGKRIYEFYYSPEFLSVKPIAHSQEKLRELSKLHNLHLITSRPSEIEEMSKKWLHTYFPHIFTSVHHTNQATKNKKEETHKKSAIAKKLKIDIMIDDHITYALDCADNEILTLLFDAPWNRHYTNTHTFLKRVASWEEICYTISHESQKPHYQNRAGI